MSPVVGVEAVQERTEYTALRGTNAERVGEGQPGAKSHSLGSVGEKIFNREACDRGKAQDCVECLPVLNMEHPCEVLLLSQVTHDRMAIAFLVDFCLVCKLIGVEWGG